MDPSISGTGSRCHCSSSAGFSGGVIHPRVCRRRPLREWAVLSRPGFGSGMPCLCLWGSIGVEVRWCSRSGLSAAVTSGHRSRSGCRHQPWTGRAGPSLCPGPTSRTAIDAPGASEQSLGVQLAPLEWPVHLVVGTVPPLRRRPLRFVHIPWVPSFVGRSTMLAPVEPGMECGYQLALCSSVEPMTPLTEIPQGCSSKFPTPGRV